MSRIREICTKLSFRNTSDLLPNDCHYIVVYIKDQEYKINQLEGSIKIYQNRIQELEAKITEQLDKIYHLEDRVSILDHKVDNNV